MRIENRSQKTGVSIQKKIQQHNSFEIHNDYNGIMYKATTSFLF